MLSLPSLLAIQIACTSALLHRSNTFFISRLSPSRIPPCLLSLLSMPSTSGGGGTSTAETPSPVGRRQKPPPCFRHARSAHSLLALSCQASSQVSSHIGSETHIRDTSVFEPEFSKVLQLHTVNKQQVARDIQLYISMRLSSGPKLRALFTGDDIDTLFRLCDGPFTIATTTLQFALGAGVDRATVRCRMLLYSTPRETV